MASIAEITLSALDRLYADNPACWQGCGPFMTPAWLTAWWRCCRGGKTPLLLQIDDDNQLLGVAPLMIDGEKISLIGSEDLCDFGEFPIHPQARQVFYRTLLDYLQKQKFSTLEFPSLRPSASILTTLAPMAKKRGLPVTIAPAGGAARMVLPGSWQEYLEHLSKKQRHEVRRKLRRTREVGHLDYRLIDNGEELGPAMERFFALFTASNPEKKRFLTASRRRFFADGARLLQERGLLQLFQVDLNREAVSMVFCIALDDTLYLYNNGYDPRFRSISIGLVAKLLTIRHGIETGMTWYDFLNGTETYKFRLGGEPVPLSACRIIFAPHQAAP